MEDQKMSKKVSKTFKIFILVVFLILVFVTFFMAKSRNPIAQVLKYFTPKIFKDKTKYNRKRDGKIWKKNVWKGLGCQD